MATTTSVSGSDLLIGSSGSDKLVGGAGSDTIDGGAGSDFINAGGGDDWIIYDEADYKILGGGGIDTLWFKGSNQNLNFGTQAINGIEALLLGGGGGHTVTFSAADVVRVSDTDRFVITGDQTSKLFIGSGWNWALINGGAQHQFTKDGATVITDWAINVVGFSNNATISLIGAPENSVTESETATTLTANGRLLVSDPNAGQGLLLPSLVGVWLGAPDKLGEFKIFPSTTSGPGEYIYQYRVDAAKVHYLGDGQTRTESFTLQTLDGSTRDLTFTIKGINDAPTLTGTPATLADGVEDTPCTFTAAQLLQGFTDVDGDTLGVGSISATHGSLANNNGTYTFTPEANYNGPVALSYTVVDGKGGSAAASLTFTLAAVNDAPAGTATATLASGTEDTDYKISSTDLLKGFSDVDGDALSVSGLTATKGTLVNNNDGTYTFKPNANYNGSVNLSYTVSDGKGGSIGGTQSFSLAAVNDPATVNVDGKMSVNEDTAVTDGKLIATGLIVISDADAGEAKISASPKAGAVNAGTLLVQEIGAGTYAYAYSVVNNDPRVQALDAGISRSDYFTVKSADGTSEITLEIKIIGTNSEVITGTPNADTLTGSTGPDRMEGLDGNDTIRGEAGNDTIYGGAGDDSIVGGLDDDVLYGDDGNDSMLGSAGDDQIFGGAGNDFIDTGGQGHDTVYGGDGNDRIIFYGSSTGNATEGTLFGGAGGDVFELISFGSNVFYGAISDFDARKSAADGGDVIKVPFALSTLRVTQDSVIQPDIFNLYHGPDSDSFVMRFIGVDFDPSKLSAYIANGNFQSSLT